MDNLNVQYIGEWLGWGNAGHFFTLLSMIAALFAAVSFFNATRWQVLNPILSNSWQKLARIGFFTHAFSVLAIFIILFYLILNHRFEYKYVWQHSSKELPIYYMISCFWEGQEGSFLLWTFWHAVLGSFIIATAKKWENGIMTIISITQIFLAAMLIGIYYSNCENCKIGSSPFVLLRNEQMGAPIFMRGDYLSFITDGNGLNPLLQNYWMVIHPPVLFLGFASTLIPFAYAIAALWQNNFNDWVKPTLLWSLFGCAILGTGIMMGGAWAYESLSFGGYWAWDPVENASLVPWLTFIAGLHTLLAYKHTGHALKPTLILFILTFIFILYSTFLTRSGILGETSVHAFTDLGMSGQLLVFLFAFLLLSLALLIYRWKDIPSIEKEENPYSREFWLFIAALILLMLSALIALDTSWPVINKIFNTKKVIIEPINHYNRYAIWFAILIAILSAVTQYFRYKISNKTLVIKKLIPSIIATIVLGTLIAIPAKLGNIAYYILLFASLFGVISNLNYLITVLKAKVKIAGASVAHIGLGIMLVGILISSSKKEVISLNTAGIDFGETMKEQEKKENILLYQNETNKMGDYFITYLGDSISPPNTYYKVKYEKKKNINDTPTESFILYPNAQINPKMGLVANPDTRHYLTHDVFTHVSSVPNKENENDSDKSSNLKKIELSVGDTAIVSSGFIVMNAINPQPANLRYQPQTNDIAAGAKVTVIDINNKKYQAEPIYYIRNNMENNVDAVIEELGMTIAFKKIIIDKNNPKIGKVSLEVIEENKPRNFIILKAQVMPFINLLWMGIIITMIGFVLSLLQRRKEKSK